METFIYWLWWLWDFIEFEMRGFWAEYAPFIVIFALVFAYVFGVSTSKYYSFMQEPKKNYSQESEQELDRWKKEK